MKYLEINRHPARSSQTARRQRDIGWIACRLSTMLDREISPRGSMQNDMFTSVAMLVVANRHIANRKRRTSSEPPRVEASKFRTHERSPVGMIARRVMKAVASCVRPLANRVLATNGIYPRGPDLVSSNLLSAS
ncbi:hypothetical protein HAP47_0036105 [Bradyrhizobium sp. 41S5]|uniref:hypothetical protein n=1 Tax=Bradyrhizobium sp. 41S5 TaxID=1404443 RepID=UPI00156A9FF2|nr:hypothetical protein [Bradyrhizobium sp. 41S5]UFX44400.1 hypothetical protein HAP47_0036105 [Bradyrhizobium sp. 41S5]